MSDLTSALGTQEITIIAVETLPSEIQSLPEGPYFLSATSDGLAVYKAYRMYVDDHGAFYYGVVQNEPEDFTIMAAIHPEASDGSATIAVPSRLYYSAPTEDKPLSGVRVSSSESNSFQHHH